jgi:hypothetical protein
MKRAILVCCVVVLVLVGLSCTPEETLGISVTKADNSTVIENTGNCGCIVFVTSPQSEQRFELAIGESVIVTDVSQPIEVSVASLRTENSQTPSLVDYGTPIAEFVTAGVLLLALLIAVRQLRHMRQERVTSLVLSLGQAYDTGVVFEGRELRARIRCEQERLGIENKQESFVNTMKYYQQQYPHEFLTLTSVPSFFDMIGWLVRRGCCSVKEIDEQIDILRNYELWEAFIREFQKKKPEDDLDDNPEATFGSFVWLSKRIRSITKNAKPTPPPGELST